MRDDSSVLSTRLPRKELDRFAACAVIFQMNEAELLRDFIFAFNDAVLSEDSRVQGLVKEKHRLESEVVRIDTEVRRFVEDSIIERSKKWTRRPAPTATEEHGPKTQVVLERFKKTAKENGIPAAVRELSTEPESIRIRVQTLIATQDKALWKEVRPVLATREFPEEKP